MVPAFPLLFFFQGKFADNASLMFLAQMAQIEIILAQESSSHKLAVTKFSESALPFWNTFM